MRTCQILSMFVALLTTGLLSGQDGNGWIDYDANYLKIDIAEDGLYRIPGTTLAEFGATNVTANAFKLYLRGEEVPIYTSTEGQVGAGDYIEFYGFKNKGELDSLLYRFGESEQLNPRYSMFNDTAVYFLSWDSGTSDVRVQNIPNDLDSPPPPEEYYMYRDYIFPDTVHLGPRLQSDVSYSNFTNGEGFGSSQRARNTFLYSVENKYSDGPGARFNARYSTSNLLYHDVALTIGNDTIEWQEGYNFQVKEFDVDIDIQDLKPNYQVSNQLTSPITGHVPLPMQN